MVQQPTTLIQEDGKYCLELLSIDIWELAIKNRVTKVLTLQTDLLLPVRIKHSTFEIEQR